MLGVGHFGEPNVRFSAEFRRQNFFRLHSLAGSNIGAEFERQPIFGFRQHRPNLGAEFRLQNLSFRGGTKPGPTSPGPCKPVIWLHAKREIAMLGLLSYDALPADEVLSTKLALLSPCHCRRRVGSSTDPHACRDPRKCYSPGTLVTEAACEPPCSNS